MSGAGAVGSQGVAAVLGRLARSLPEGALLAGAEVPDRYTHDWSGLPPVRPLALVRPRSTAEVAAALRVCHEAGLPVVPQGGLTGLAGGAQPLAEGVALSLERLDAIEEVDVPMATITLGAGVTLAAAQAAAEAEGLMLGIDLGARGSCTIGGVIATNAGGNRVIRYGMTRDHVLGLEAVLADGTVLSALNKMLKNNAGLDLKQLFIGTEGQLGVVTRAVLRLQPQPGQHATGFCGCADTAAAIALLALARRRLGPALSTFEALWPSFYDFMAEGCSLRRPLTARHGVYVLIEASGFGEGGAREPLEACLAEAIGEGIATDAVLAASLREERELWAVRESVGEITRLLGDVINFDVGIPLGHMAAAVERIEAGLAERFPQARALSFGHLGDSNLHVAVGVPRPGPPLDPAPIKDFVYGVVQAFDGTISAEHGIGLLKRAWLGHSRSAAEIAAMGAIKQALDPRGILNPGRGFA